jgi:trans-aconitate methyltransferase
VSSVVSFLWPKNAQALQHYVTSVPSAVHSPQSLLALVSPETRVAVSAEAKARSQGIAGEMQGHKWHAAIANDLERKLSDMMLLIAGLDSAHAADPIELVILNEDVTQQSKTAANWAKARGVPSVVVSHSCILGRLYTVHREDRGYMLAVFGERGAQPYTEMGVPANRIALTGNPSWDVYAQLVPHRSQIRSELGAAHGFAQNDLVVVFATTWPAFLTAFCDPNHYETSLRAVLRSVRELRDLGVPLRLVIKERPANAQKTALLEQIIREEAGECAPIVTHQDLERWIVAADAVISVDSNVSIEAMIAGTVPINLWTPMSWLNGPFFDAEDGVMEVSPEKLSLALAHALGDPAMRTQLHAQARARLQNFTSGVGNAAARVGDLLAKTHRGQAQTTAPRYAWQELSQPRGIAEKGATATYYRNARHDMISLIRRAPRIAVEVGCGDGITGAEIKRKFSSASVCGIEINKEAAAIAATRLDRVLTHSIETLDYAGAGFEPRSIDLVLFPDVLEHLYDPWNVLVRLKPFLAPDAQILASIPNVRNFWLMNRLLSGNWDYTEDGLLDVTHIRFFTKKSVTQLFQQTGYRITAMHSNVDVRVPEMQSADGRPVNIDSPNFTLKNMSPQDLIELRTLQFVVDAAPA